jgi:Rps23 Pro-64 3,4-dihydroxylase Tpa1-like proline 4-hydroxylase
MERRESPVPHYVLDDVPGLSARQLAAAVPPPAWEHWVRYANDDERKRTSRDLVRLGESFSAAVETLLGRAAEFARWFGIDGLVPDESLHGGGVHVSGPGDYLQCHLDYARHPYKPELERRVNAIYYAVPEWREQWGGATCLYAPDGETVLSRVYPKPGRLFVFEVNDLAYHGVEPVTCPAGVERVTLATYYLAPIRPGVTRQRALFVPNRKKAG